MARTLGGLAKSHSKMLIFIPFLLISFQNAYTYSLIKVDDFTGHSLNYLALFIGAGMFVLWNWYYSLAIIVPSILASGYFFQMNHHLNMQEALINGGLLLLVVAIFMFLLIETRYRLTISVIKFKIALMEANDAVAEEKAQSDKLLRNILPDEVADELKTTGKASAKHYPKVSVLFTDFKGFTARSANMTPEEVIEELNKCFSAFDAIVEKYNLEKIKTIGDAYMAAGGLPKENTTHPIDVVMAAEEVLMFMAELKQERLEKNLPYFDIRIGIHSGPVIAGIVGIKKFSYDIWGDTVNTASRMESSGEINRINISGATHEMIKSHYICEYRGKIEAKNKGKIDMYFIEKRIV
jgi:class 3 adenylate cyclase